MRLPAFAFATLLLTAQAEAAPKVVASVMPVQGIVAAVMEGVGAPDLLLEGQLSEHRAAFTPSQIAELGEADVVFIIGHGLEAKLAQLSGSEAVNGKAFVELSEAPGVTTLPVREGGAWEPHDHDHEETHAGEAEEHSDGILAFDPHVWLDPENAKAMAAHVAATLAATDPANAPAYTANASKFAAMLDNLKLEIDAAVAPVRGRPYVVFHDAYQYFEQRFDLAAVGAIADVSAQAPSAGRLKEIRDKIAATKAVCVFREPQYDDKLVATVIEGTGARAGVLDGLGAGLQAGPAAYPQLLRNLADALKDCLQG